MRGEARASGRRMGASGVEVEAACAVGQGVGGKVTLSYIYMFFNVRSN